MSRALEVFIVEGVYTDNSAAPQNPRRIPDFRAGNFDTGFIERFLAKNEKKGSGGVISVPGSKFILHIVDAAGFKRLTNWENLLNNLFRQAARLSQGIGNKGGNWRRDAGSRRGYSAQGDFTHSKIAKGAIFRTGRSSVEATEYRAVDHEPLCSSRADCRVRWRPCRPR